MAVPGGGLLRLFEDHLSFLLLFQKFQQKFEPLRDGSELQEILLIRRREVEGSGEREGAAPRVVSDRARQREGLAQIVLDGPLRPVGQPGGRGLGRVVEEFHVPERVGPVGVGPEKAETALPPGEDVHPPVRQFLDDLDDPRRASRLPDPTLLRQDHSEGDVLLQTLPDHLLEAILEDVQGQALLRQEDDREREKAQGLGFHTRSLA